LNTSQVWPLDEPKGNTKAFASVSVEDLIAIRNIRVMDGIKGLFINMPQSKDSKSGEYHDIAFPLNKELRQQISKAIIDEYKIQVQEKSADKKTSLAENLQNGAEKATGHVPAKQTGAIPIGAERAG